MHTDIKKLEAELNYEILPGTEVMADTNRVAFIKAGETVLIPQPSSSPNDPLNWTPFWKTGSVTCAVLLGFIQGEQLAPRSLHRPADGPPYRIWPALALVANPLLRSRL